MVLLARLNNYREHQSQGYADRAFCASQRRRRSAHCATLSLISLMIFPMELIIKHVRGKVLPRVVPRVVPRELLYLFQRILNLDLQELP